MKKLILLILFLIPFTLKSAPVGIANLPYLSVVDGTNIIIVQGDLTYRTTLSNMMFWISTISTNTLPDLNDVKIGKGTLTNTVLISTLKMSPCWIERTNTYIFYSHITNAAVALIDNDDLYFLGNNTNYILPRYYDGVTYTEKYVAAIVISNKSNIRIFGNGATLYSTNWGNFLMLFACTNVTIENLTFESNWPGIPTNNAGDGILTSALFLAGTNNIGHTIRNCKFIKIGDQAISGLYLAKNSFDITIEGNYFNTIGEAPDSLGSRDWLDGAAVSGIGNRWIVRDNYLYNCARGIECQSGWTPNDDNITNVIISGNTVISNRGTPIFIGDDDYYSDVIIENNKVFDIYTTKLTIPPCGIKIGCGSNIVVKGNVVRRTSCAVNEDAFAYGILIYAKELINLVVQNNIISDIALPTSNAYGQGIGIVLNNNYTNSNISIEGNNISKVSRNGRGICSFTYGKGILRNVDIKNNTLYNIDNAYYQAGSPLENITAGIYIGYGSNITVSGNTVYDDRSGASKLTIFGACFGNHVTNVYLGNNNFEGTISRGFTNFCKSLFYIDPDRSQTLAGTELKAAWPITLPHYMLNSNSVSHFNAIALDEPWNGYKYWAAYSGYPDNAEMAHCAVSYDGVKWFSIMGPTNAVNLSLTWGDRQADAEINLSPNNVMSIYWCESGSGHIVRSFSSDGVTWSSPALCFQHRNAVCPSVVNEDNGQLTMWCWNTSSNAMFYYYSEDYGAAWTVSDGCVNVFNNQPFTVWHYDVTKVGSNYVMVYTSSGSLNPYLSIAWSTNRYQWEILSNCIPIKPPGLPFEEWIHYGAYQCSLVPKNNWPMTFDLYFTTHGGATPPFVGWRLGMMKDIEVVPRDFFVKNLYVHEGGIVRVGMPPGLAWDTTDDRYGLIQMIGEVRGDNSQGYIGIGMANEPSSAYPGIGMGSSQGDFLSLANMFLSHSVALRRVNTQVNQKGSLTRDNTDFYLTWGSGGTCYVHKPIYLSGNIYGDTNIVIDYASWVGPTNNIYLNNSFQLYDFSGDSSITGVVGNASGKYRRTTVCARNSSGATKFVRMTELGCRPVGINTTNELAIPAGKIGYITIESFGLSITNYETKLEQ